MFSDDKNDQPKQRDQVGEIRTDRQGFSITTTKEIMSTQQPFMPKYGSGFAVSPGVASANSAIETSNNQVRVTNTGAAIGFFRTYSSGTAAGVVVNVLVIEPSA